MAVYVKGHRRGRSVVRAHSRKMPLFRAARKYIRANARLDAAVYDAMIPPRQRGAIQGSYTKAMDRFDKIANQMYPGGSRAAHNRLAKMRANQRSRRIRR